MLFFANSIAYSETAIPFLEWNRWTRSRIPPRVRLDTPPKHRSGPQYAPMPVAPVRGSYPGTTPVSELVSSYRHPNGEEEQSWRSCSGACGAGCGDNFNTLMPACRRLSNATNTWSGMGPDGQIVSVQCSYYMWECKTHPDCQWHDNCLSDCERQFPSLQMRNSRFDACKSACHIPVSNTCAQIWMYGRTGMNGRYYDYCFSNPSLKYSEIIRSSCHEVPVGFSNCPNIQIWNGSECVCPPGTLYSSTSDTCYRLDLSPHCQSPRVWNGTSCACPSDMTEVNGMCVRGQMCGAGCVPNPLRPGRYQWALGSASSCNCKNLICEGLSPSIRCPLTLPEHGSPCPANGIMIHGTCE